MRNNLLALLVLLFALATASFALAMGLNLATGPLAGDFLNLGLNFTIDSLPLGV